MARGKYKALRQPDDSGEYGDEAEYEYEDDAAGQAGVEPEDGEYESTAVEAEYEDGDYEEGEYETEAGDEEYGTEASDESEEYEYEYEEEGEYEDEGEPYRPPGAFAALKQSFQRRPGERARPATGTDEDEQRVTYLTSKERLIGYFFGGAMIVLALLLYVTLRHYVDTSNLKQQSTDRRNAPWILTILGVLGLMILAGTISKRRAALGFTLLLAGIGAFSIIGVLGLMYLGVGGWLIFKAMRRPSQVARAARGDRPPAAGSRAGRAAATARDRSSGPAVASGPPRQIGRNNRAVVAPTTASKRYTPPKPPRRTPPPAPQPEPEPSNRLSAWLRK